MSHTRNILVPTDFSEYSEAAVDYACQFANHAASLAPQIQLLHVVSDAPGGGMYEAKIRKRLRSLSDWVDARMKQPQSTVYQILPGDPARIITDYAHGNAIDLIVMGTHGRSGLSHVALGSVAERVVRNSACPVLVMGPKAQMVTALRNRPSRRT